MQRRQKLLFPVADGDDAVEDADVGGAVGTDGNRAVAVVPLDAVAGVNLESEKETNP